ncbi:response regulator transcription factor [Cohnella phaseoli]|uniref:Two-component system response regulator VanR n=1 Tax=Cohnella phaseoli TaxID=456490 RepID=A0A3D9JM74_9BACL|nr:response regulator transcription factor [Cohnella phaseoli]RED75085.1 two-component system response regulator VanR [Cohnella phaseoli]
MIKVLIIEDDSDIQELVREFLTAQNYTVDTSNDGLEGIQLFHENEYDLILLDVMLPKLDGYGVCRMIRQKSSVPIIMLTALGEERDEIKGFELGIDDYIAKPFSFNLLIKRVEAVLRRASDKVASGVIRFKEIVLDKDGFTVTVDDNSIDLTAKEFRILHCLMENQGRTVSREALLNRGWGYDYFGDERIVDTHIKNLRKKLGIPYIRTITGIGYKIDD